MNNNNYYNNQRDGDLPFFEDTHRTPDYNAGGSRDMNGYYRSSQQPAPGAYSGGNLYPDRDSSLSTRDYTKKIPKNFNNVMVYKPKTEIDSKMIIDFIRRNEPAIIDLGGAEPAVSQRILDFVAGAVYALSGTVHRVTGNIFLLSPSGVEVTVPYEVNDD